jgi:nucleotide-binding universal stress UspA family protein
VYDRIVVALDGSELAERVLPLVAPLVEKFGSSVTLLRATRPTGAILTGAAGGAAPLASPILDPAPIVEAERREAAEYLDMLVTRMSDVGLRVQTATPEGPGARAIVEYARRTGADLLALTTHGRGGLGRLVFGSVADEVLRHAPCPVLLVRVDEDVERAELT